ncbi:uncharacterized protein EMH_0032940 [Eimeria mitis]|uniref:Uncharacterized protein n=1 Tax=Eimeria mitis TaxID=44415 RepID=U6JVM1_9EIME|nr:uncharacterized protein EMH_0032940 [Eimeria mitis]CDJ27568.1 hypothetical protein EMH_0032940 [Eimeria mitis]
MCFIKVSPPLGAPVDSLSVVRLWWPQWAPAKETSDFGPPLVFSSGASIGFLKGSSLLGDLFVFQRESKKQCRLHIDELGTVRKQFAMKYGDVFVESAVKNAKQEVHFKLVHALSLAPPPEFDIQQLLYGIAEEYCISDWKPSIPLVRRLASQ